MSSAATESLPTLRERVGGRWFGSWAMWALSMPAGLLVITSDLTTAESPRELGRWLLVWVVATAVDAVVMWGLQCTILRGRLVHPWPVWSVVVTGGIFGAFYGLLLWGAATVTGAASPTAWPLRVAALALIGLWFVPLISVSLDTVARGRAQRKRDIDALVAVEIARWEEVDVARDIRAEILSGVTDTLDPLRARVDAALSDLESEGSLVVPRLANDLRDGAELSLRPLSRELWTKAAAQYPRIPWERTIAHIVRTQPLRTIPLAVVSLLVDGVFVLAERGFSQGILLVLMTTAAVVVISILCNASMERWPRRHALWFVLGLLAVIAVGLGALFYRQQLWGEDLDGVDVIVFVVFAVLTVLITSGFGSWRSEIEAMRATFRAEVDAEFIAARVRSQHLADIARDAARVLHGSVQSRLVACAMAIDRASASGDREALVVALGAAREALEEPLPERAVVSGSIADEVSRKVALWGDACEFTVIVAPGVAATAVDPLTVGRVVEEGLTNAIRHGAATAISVSVGVEVGGVVIVVADDGIGPKESAAGLGSALLDQMTGGAWSLDRVGDLTVLCAHVPASRLPMGNSVNV